MTTNTQIALAKTQSIKISLVNAIMELESRAERARLDNDQDLSRRLSLQSVALSKEALRIHQVEAEIRSRTALKVAIKKLSGIAGEARDTVSLLRKTADALGAAARMIGTLGKLATIFA